MLVPELERLACDGVDDVAVVCPALPWIASKRRSRWPKRLPMRIMRPHVLPAFLNALYIHFLPLAPTMPAWTRWPILLPGLPSFLGHGKQENKLEPSQPKDCGGPKGRAVFERREAY